MAGAGSRSGAVSRIGRPFSRAVLLLASVHSCYLMATNCHHCVNQGYNDPDPKGGKASFFTLKGQLSYQV